jgi:hypothetical protein
LGRAGIPACLDYNIGRGFQPRHKPVDPFGAAKEGGLCQCRDRRIRDVAGQVHLHSRRVMIEQRPNRCIAALAIKRFADGFGDGIVDGEEPIVASGHK